jgi:hypothetical protein
MDTSHPPAGARRVTRPTAKLADGNNLEKAPLGFQRMAVQAENARVKAIQAMQQSDSESHGSNASFSTLPQSSKSIPASPSPSVSTRPTTPSHSDEENECNTLPTAVPVTKRHRDRPVISSESDNEYEKPENAPKKKKNMKKRTHSTANKGKLISIT